MTYPTNDTNTTDLCSDGVCSSARTTLAVVLTLLFVFLGVGIAVTVFVTKQYIKRRNRSRSDVGDLKSMEEEAQMVRVDSGRYTTMARPQPATEHSPVYENYTAQTGHTGSYGESLAIPSRSLQPSEEDMYLQFDEPDDAIYSNDPASILRMHPDTGDTDDLYFMPDDV